jgi:hypothetical protein
MNIDISKLSEAELANALKAKRKQKETDVMAYNDLVNETIPGLFLLLKEYSEKGTELKAKIYSSIKSLLELKYKIYGVKTEQQSHTFSTDNETITIGYNVNSGYDDTVYIGVAKVKEFINSQIEDEKTAKLVNQINRLLRPDKKGNFRPERILELKQMANEYHDFNFIEGVEIIEKSYKPTRSSWYIRATYKNGVGIEVNLPLSISTAPFPTDFDLSFLLPNITLNNNKK